MCLLGKSETASFFDYIKAIKGEKDAWNIVEVGLLEETAKQYSIDDIGAKLSAVFDDRDGVALICNSKEILALVRWGDASDVGGLCHRVNNNMPEHACYVNAEEMTMDGLQKVQIKLVEDPGDTRSFAQRRKERTETSILIVTDDKDIKISWSAVMKEFGKCVFANDLDKILLVNLEEVPNMILWDIDSVSPKFSMVFSQDPDASITALSEVLDINKVIEFKEAGLMDFVKKPLDEKTASRLVGTCKHFSW